MANRFLDPEALQAAATANGATTHETALGHVAGHLAQRSQAAHDELAAQVKALLSRVERADQQISGLSKRVASLERKS